MTLPRVPRLDSRRRSLCGALGLAGALAGCVSIGSGEAPAQVYLQLHDPGTVPTRRASPLVEALLIQTQAADALADGTAIAYARQPHAYATYQLASWSERPPRQLARLLQQRLEARGLAGQVGQLGEPLQADWSLSLTVDALFHDAAVLPGRGQVAFTLGLVDRRRRVRVAQRRFEATAAAARGEAAAAVTAMSQALGQALDTALPWLEAELQRAASAGR